MRRAVLVGLVLLHGAASACSPVPLSSEATKASDRLFALRLRKVPCPTPQPPRHWTACEVYAARPAQVLPLLALAHASKVVREGGRWSLTTGDGSGTKLRVSFRGRYTLVNLQRPITVQDKLHSDLRRSLTEGLQSWRGNFWRQLFQRPDCQDLGLNDNAWYRIESCRFVPQRSVPGSTRNTPPSIEISLRSAVDRTVPLRQPQRFGHTADSCDEYDFF